MGALDVGCHTGEERVSPKPEEINRFRIKLESSGVENNSRDVIKISQPIMNDLRGSATNRNEIIKRLICNFSQAQL